MPRFTDKQNAATAIELARAKNGRFYAGLFARNEYDNARRRLVRRYWLTQHRSRGAHEYRFTLHGRILPGTACRL